MNAPLSLPPVDDLDTVMLKVARNLAMGIYELDTILENLEVNRRDFDRWKTHPNFLHYLKSEREAWSAAVNTPERTKLKAAVIMEDFMVKAHSDLHNDKTPLNQRVELGKLVAKIAGMGEPKNIGGVGGPGFQLHINIGPGVSDKVTITPQFGKIINYDEPTDEYDPLISPNTLEDF